jgi:hypothetical protein
VRDVVVFDINVKLVGAVGTVKVSEREDLDLIDVDEDGRSRKMQT